MESTYIFPPLPPKSASDTCVAVCVDIVRCRWERGIEQTGAKKTVHDNQRIAMMFRDDLCVWKVIPPGSTIARMDVD